MEDFVVIKLAVKKLVNCERRTVIWKKCFGKLIKTFNQLEIIMKQNCKVSATDWIWRQAS